VLRGEILVAGSIVVVAAHLASSSDAVFATMEYLISASGTVVVASKIGGAAFASASTFGSSAVA
jgi:hypothetical protein